MRKYALPLFSAVVVATGLCSTARAQTAYLGQVYTFAFNFCPQGFATMNGQLLSISQNTALFSLLGTTYGGDGRTTFALPKAMAAPTLTPGTTFLQCIALQGIFPSRP